MVQNRPTFRPERSERQDSSKDITSKDDKLKETADTANRVSEAAGDLEVGFETGKVAEVAREQSEQKGDSVASGGKGAKTDPVVQAKLRATLLAQAPAEAAMRVQIEKEIRNEIKHLHKQIAKTTDHFHMVNLVRKIRELNGILKLLFKASIDGVKTLWLRFVHGIM